MPPAMLVYQNESLREVSNSKGYLDAILAEEWDEWDKSVWSQFEPLSTIQNLIPISNLRTLVSR